MNSKSSKRSLEEVFVSTFHNKMSFTDFTTLNIDDEYKVIDLKKRRIYAPSPKLKKIHRFINKTVLEYAQFNEDVVFSYRKGFSTRDAVDKHANNKYFFQTDITDFYNSISLENVKYTLETQLENVPISDIKEYIQNILNLVVVDNHIPVGFSTSPLLSNICLMNFDNSLLKFCRENNLVYTRYSDDLIISGETKDFTSTIEKVVKETLKEKINSNAELNASKTKTHKKGHDFKLLGFSILPNGIATIPSSDKKEIESMLYFYLTNPLKFEDYVLKNMGFDKNEMSKKSIREYGASSLSGKLIAFNSMDKSYISKLRKKYGNTLIDMFIRKSVK